MRLLEFQAKRLLSLHGIVVPNGTLVTDSDEFAQLRYPAVLKAQVPVGGRGKAGAIAKVDNAEQAVEVGRKLFEMTIGTYPIRQILVEELIPVERELYLSIVVDKVQPVPLLLASAEGGIDIEEVGRLSPEKIHRFRADPCLGFVVPVIRYLSSQLSVQVDPLGGFVRALLEVFHAYDATMVEINPLAVVGNDLVALDAKITLDDNASFRHGQLHAELAAEQRVSNLDNCSPEDTLKKLGIAYVSLEGNVALISDGAGTGMLTLDLIEDAGGRPANFCELGGAAGAETMQHALGVVLSNPNASVVLISLLGGLTRMDDVAAGVIAYMKDHDIEIPLVVRMCGTQEEAGRAMLQEVGIKTLDDLPSAVQVAVNLAGEHRA